MLGLRIREKSSTNWQWYVAGKHPVARDFFALGQKSLIAEALTEWIRCGAEGLVATSKDLLVHSCSWRFWAKTPQTRILACGVIRNSCDSVGRPFPLLVMGTGMLEEWEDNWELLPFACEGLWRQMEQLGSKKYASFELFQRDVSVLRPPLRSWEDMKLEKVALVEKSESSPDFNCNADVLGQEQAMFLPFQDTGHNDFFAMIINAHSLLRMKVDAAPNSLFMGGLRERPGLALFRRPLALQDFERMWMPETR